MCSSQHEYCQHDSYTTTNNESDGDSGGGDGGSDCGCGCGSSLVVLLFDGPGGCWLVDLLLEFPYDQELSNRTIILCLPLSAMGLKLGFKK